MALLFAIALAQGVSVADIEWIGEDEVAERLAECGLEQVEFENDDELQTDFVIIGDPEITEHQLHCTAEAVDLTVYVALLPEQYRQRFSEIHSALWAPRLRASALAYFERRGLREQAASIPFENITDSEATQAIVELCGPQAEGAFTSNHGAVTIDPEWMGGRVIADAASMEPLSCVLNGLSVGNIRFGFIGNERYPPED